MFLLRRIIFLFYIIVMSTITIITSNNDYSLGLFLNYKISIYSIIEILKTYFIKYNIVIVIFYIWFDKFSKIEILYIIRAKELFIYIKKSMYKYHIYITIYYVLYGIIISFAFFNQFDFKKFIIFITSSVINSTILFLLFTILSIKLKSGKINVFYLIILFSLIINSYKIYMNKFLSFLYELINNSNYMQINAIYYFKSIMVIILLIIRLKKIVEKSDIT